MIFQSSIFCIQAITFKSVDLPLQLTHIILNISQERTQKLMSFNT